MVAHGRCIQTDERARNERDSGRCSVWKTKSCVACMEKQLLSGKPEPLLFFSPQGSMEDTLFRPATLLLDDRMSPGMRQGAGLLWSHSKTFLPWEYFISFSSFFHFLLFSFLPIYKEN